MALQTKDTYYALFKGLEADLPATPDDPYQVYVAYDSGKVWVADGLTWQAVSAVAGAGEVTTINLVIDGSGSAIATGVKLDLQIDFACTITAATLLADQSGSIVIDLWKDTYANFPPTVADTITASAKPTIAAATKATDTTLTGWTTGISASDILRVNVDSCTSITRVTLALKVTRT